MNKGKLTEVIGDVTTPQRVEEDEIVVIPHVCNDEGGWDAGVVLAISRKWTGPEYLYKSFVAGRGKGEHLLGCTGFWDSNGNKVMDNVIVCNMIAQHSFISSDNPRPLNYGALAKCMNDVAEKIKDKRDGWCFKSIRIHAPKFGSDLAKGDFGIILEFIDYIWIHKGIDVIIYEYVG